MNPTEIEAGKSYRGTDDVVRKVENIYQDEWEDDESVVRYSVDHRGFLTMPLNLFALKSREVVE